MKKKMLLYGNVMNFESLMYSVARMCSTLVIAAVIAAVLITPPASGLGAISDNKKDNNLTLTDKVFEKLQAEGVDPEFLERAWANVGASLAKDVTDRLSVIPDFPGKATLSTQSIALGLKMGKLKTVEDVRTANELLTGMFQHIGVSEGKLNVLLTAGKSVEQAGQVALAMQTIVGLMDPLSRGDNSEAGRKAASALSNLIVYNQEFRGAFDNITKGKATDAISSFVKNNLGDGRLSKVLNLELGAGTLNSSFFKTVPVEDAVNITTMMFAGDFKKAGVEGATVGMKAALSAAGVPLVGQILAAYQIVKASSDNLDQEEYLFKKDMTQYTVYEKDAALRNPEIPTANKVDYFISKYVMDGNKSFADMELIKLVQTYGNVDLKGAAGGISDYPHEWTDPSTGKISNNIRVAVFNLLKDYEVILGARDLLRETQAKIVVAKELAKALPEVAAKKALMEEDSRKFQKKLANYLADLASTTSAEDREDMLKFMNGEVKRLADGGVIFDKDVALAQKAIQEIITANPLGGDENVPKILSTQPVIESENDIKDAMERIKNEKERAAEALKRLPSLIVQIRETISGIMHPAPQFDLEGKIIPPSDKVDLWVPSVYGGIDGTPASLVTRSRELEILNNTLSIRAKIT